MKIALVFVVTLAATVFATWHSRARSAARAEQVARVLQLDPRKVEPSTRALLLLETIPHLRHSERDVAVKQLRSALEVVPRGLVLHHPSFPVETLRFSGNGRAVLWYGKTADGIRIERWSQREPRVVSWQNAASNVTFRDEAGRHFVTDEKPDARAEPGLVMSRDGGYLSLVQGGVLGVWRLRDVGVVRGRVRAAFAGEVPYATTRLHCVQSTDLCGLETPGRFTIIDIEKNKILRSIVAGRRAAVHMSPSGRLVGVASPRAGITIHAARHGRKIHLDTSSLALEDFTFSADEESVLAVDRDGVLHSYDVATGKPRTRSPLLRHERWKSPLSVETAGDGRFLVWDAEKVRLVSADLSTVAGRFDEGGEVVLVKTNAGGDWLAIARRPGPLTLWDVSPKVALPLSDAELLKSVCDHVGRPLTAREWTTYMPNRPYTPSCR